MKHYRSDEACWVLEDSDDHGIDTENNSFLKTCGGVLFQNTIGGYFTELLEFALFYITNSVI